MGDDYFRLFSTSLHFLEIPLNPYEYMSAGFIIHSDLLKDKPLIDTYYMPDIINGRTKLEYLIEQIMHLNK